MLAVQWRQMRQLILGIVTAACLGAVTADRCGAYYQDYVPTKLQNLRPIKQKTVALDFGHDWASNVLPGIRAENIEGQFSVSGIDSTGASWKISEEEPRDLGGSCYIADVDGNGKPDILLHFPNGSCGLPFSSLVIVFIDLNGRPHREELLSRFSLDKNGVADIVKAEAGEGSIVLQQDLAFGRQGQRDMGYWRWSAWLAHDCKLIEARSAFATKFPCFVFFTNKPNHLLSKNSEVLEQLFRKAH